MKIYAKQVPPEYQESPLFLGDEFWPENVFVFGNRDYNQHDEYLQDIRRGLENIAEIYEDMQNGYSETNNLHAAILYNLPRNENRGYTRPERLEIVKLALEYCDLPSADILCRALEIVTGRKWENTTICGCCQGDWQDIIYPAEYGREWLEAFEAEYFNTGEEWMVDPDGDNISVYTHGWGEDDVRQEIADAYGCDPADVVLLKFTGWSRSASYEEVSA